MARKCCSKECRLIFYNVLSIFNVCLSLGVGIYTNMVSLLADAFAQLAGVISVLIGLITIRLGKRPPTAKYTYGYQRAELVGALVNASFLIGLCVSAALQSVALFTAPEPLPPTEAQIALLVGLIGISVNLVGVIFTAQCKCGCCKKDDSEKKAAVAPEVFVNQAADTANERQNSVSIEYRNRNGTVDSDSDAKSIGQGEPRPPVGNLNRKASHFSMVSRKMSHYSLHSIAAAITKPDLNTPWVGRRASVFPRKEEEEMMDDIDMAGQQMETSSTGMRAVFITVMSDALGSIVVVLVATFTILWGCKGEEGGEAKSESATSGTPICHEEECNSWVMYADPTLTIINVAIVLTHTIALIPELVNLVLDAAPEGVDIGEIRSRLLQMDGVLSVHELHVRQLQAQVNIATLHVRVESFANERLLQRRIKNMFHEYLVHSTTIQLEKVEYDNSDDPDKCEILCPFAQSCHVFTCCGSHKKAPEPPFTVLPAVTRAPPPNANSNTHAITPHVVVQENGKNLNVTPNGNSVHPPVVTVVVSDSPNSQQSPRAPRSPRSAQSLSFDDHVTEF